MARRTLTAWLFVAALAAAGGAAIGAQSPDRATAADRTVTVTGGPYTPGQKATVSWTGFTPDNEVYIYVCEGDGGEGTPTVASACFGETLVSGASDGNGAGSAEFEVRSRLTPQLITAPGSGAAEVVGADFNLDCRAPRGCDVVVSECSANVPEALSASAPYTLAPMPQGMHPGNSDDPYVVARFESYDGDPHADPNDPGVEGEWYYTRKPFPRPPDPPDPPSWDVATGPAIETAGSDLGLAVETQWARGAAGALNIRFKNTTIDYVTAVDSLINGGLDIAFTAAPLSEEQKAALTAKGQSLVFVPVTVSTLGIALNAYPGLPLRELRISPNTMAGLLYPAGQPAGSTGSLTSALWQTDQGPCLPAKSRATVTYFKAGYSDATYRLSSWLDRTASDVAWPLGVINQMPTDQNPQPQIWTTHKVVAPELVNPKFADSTMISRNARLGLTDYTWARRENLPMAELQNASYQWVKPSVEGALATLRTSTIREDHTVDVDYTSPEPGAYPLVSVTYAVVPVNLSEDFTAADADAVRQFLTYVLSDEGQQLAVDEGFVPMPFELRHTAASAIAEVGSVDPPAPTTTTTSTTTAVTSTVPSTSSSTTSPPAGSSSSSSSSSTTSSTSTSTTVRTTQTTRPGSGSATTNASGTSATTPFTTTVPRTTTTVDGDDDDSSNVAPITASEADDPPPPADVFDDLFGSTPFTPALPTLGATGAAAAVTGQGVALWRRQVRKPKLTSWTP